MASESNNVDSETDEPFAFMKGIEPTIPSFNFINDAIVERGKPAIAVAKIKRKKTEKDGQIDGKKRETGADSSSTPFGNEDLKKNHIGELRSSQSMLHTREWYSTVNTSMGTFIARVAPKLATRNWPKVRTFKDSTRKLKPKMNDYIEYLWWKYWAELWITSTMQHSEGAGRALCFLEQISPAGQNEEWRLGFAPIEDDEIDYEKITVIDENGEPQELASGKVIKYHPFVKRGMEKIQLHIDPENGVLFKAEPDPYGNLEEGIPQTLGAYNTIKRIENIEDSSARLYKNRGLGLAHFTVEGASPEDCDKYAEDYGNPDEFTIMFTDERFKMNVIEGIKSGYNLSQTIDTFKEGLSEGTGYPQAAFQGGSEGQMSTSETNSDTKETIIQTIQKRYEKYILKVLYMLDRKEDNKKLEDKKLYLVWEHTIKMDKQKEVNVKATVAGYVNSVSAILTVDDVLEEFGKPPHEDPETGKMIYAEYKQQFAPEPFGGGETPPGEEKGEMKANVPTPPKFEERSLNNQLNKKDALIRLFKSGIKCNEALRILKDISGDGKAINRTVANKLYQQVNNGEI